MKEFVFELQRFAETSQLEILKTLGNIVTTLGLNKLAEDLDNAKNATEWLKNNANPILNFIGKKTPLGEKFGNYAKLITGSISIVDNTLAILKGDLPDATRAQKFGLISSSLEAMAGATEELIRSKKFTSKSSNLWFMSIVSAGISLVANIIAGSDGIEPKEKEAINRSYITFMRTLGTDLAKKIFNAATDAQFNRLLTENVMEEAISNGKFFQSASKTFTKAFGIVMTFGTGILNGVDKYKLSMKKYTDDGIPEKIAKHDAFIDALAKFIKETLSGIVVGLDNVIFNGSKWIFSLFGIKYAEDKEDYVEVLADYFKTLNYKNSGTSGDDKFYVLEDKSMVYGDSGNDDIGNYGFSNVTIWGGHDDDTLGSYRTDSATPQENSIFGGPGDDQISVYDKNSTISGGTGKDFINVVGTNNEIFGDEGDDKFYIANGANDNTISGGTGDDFVAMLEEAKNTVIKYASGDGNDTIYGFNEDDSLKISGVYKTSVSDNNVKVMIDDGSILLVDMAGKNININGKTIKSGEENSTIEPLPPPEFPILPATVASPIIRGSNGYDNILNNRNHNYVIIQALEGDDEIYNGSILGLDNYYGGLNVTIDGGAGNDEIYNYEGDYSSINGGAGNDTIKNGGYWYDDTRYRYFHSGGKNVTISGGSGDDSIENNSKASLATIDAGEGNDFISNEADNVSINGGEGNDKISNGGKKSKLIGGKGDDYIGNDGESVTINAGEGNDYISNLLTANLLTGHYASISGGEGNDYIYNEGSNVTINGGEDNDEICLDNSSARYNSKNVLIAYNAGDGDDTISGFDGNDTLSISSGSYFTTKSGDDIIVTGGDGSISLVGAANLDNLNIIGTLADTDDTADDSTDDIFIDNKLKETEFIIRGNKRFVDASKRTKPIRIIGNSLDNSIVGGKGNDTLDGASGDDTLTGGKGSDLFIFNGGNDFIADYEKKDKINVGGLSYTDFAVDGDDVIFNFGDDNSLTIENGASKQINLNDNANYYTVYGVLDKRKKSITLLSTVEKYTADSKVMTIDGAATGAIEIVGNKKKNYIIAGATGSTLNGGKGKDTLVGGAGADLFIYDNRTGKDIIEGFGAGDSISIDSDVMIKDAKTKSGDTVLKFKGGGLTVKNTTEFTFGETTYKGSVFIADDIAKIYGSFKGTIDLADYAVANFDGSQGRKKLTITGDDSANYLIGGKGKDNLSGGAGDDTLWGGKGNDTFTGGAGNDTFIYQAGTGKDFITDYTAGDLLQILNKKGDTGTFSKATFKDDTLTLAIQGGGKVILSGVDTSTDFNINGDSYYISDNTLTK